MSVARRLSPAEVQHAINALHALLGRYGSAEAVAKRLKMQDGSEVAGDSVTVALDNHHLDAPLAEAIALKAGVPFEDLVSGRSVVPDGTQRFGDVPGWEDAAAAAGQAGVPANILHLLSGSFVPFVITTASPKMVVDIANHWVTHGRHDLQNLSRFNCAPRYENLPGWDHAAAVVAREQLFPGYLVTILGDSFVPFPPRHVDPRLIVDIGGLRTAQRYAKPGRPNRLPVVRYDNGHVYINASAIALCVKGRPIGSGPGRANGSVDPPREPPRDRAHRVGRAGSGKRIPSWPVKNHRLAS